MNKEKKIIKLNIDSEIKDLMRKNKNRNKKTR